MHAGRLLSERYEIRSAIAEGGSGAVWAALDRTTGVDVAVKAISLDRAGWRTEVRDRFLQEAKLLRLIEHENLVALRDVGETEDGYLFTVLELLQGETLAARVARPPRMLWPEARDIALALARGLAALHERAIIHRDLKPGNVVLHRADGRVVPKLIDLGISKVRAAADPAFRESLTATGQVLGTPQYMSYEQALGDREIDARSDVWSLGVVLYEMLAARPPFQASNVNAVLAAIRKEQPPPLADLAPHAPDPLVRIAMRCLERDPDARYRDGGALSAALADLGGSAPHVPAAPPPPPPIARAPWVRVLAVALGGGLVLGAIAAVGLSSSSSSNALPTEAAAPPVADAAPTAIPVRLSDSAKTVVADGAVSAAPSTIPNTPPSASASKGSSAHPRPVTKIDSAGF